MNADDFKGMDRVHSPGDIKPGDLLVYSNRYSGGTISWMAVAMEHGKGTGYDGGGVRCTCLLLFNGEKLAPPVVVCNASVQRLLIISRAEE